MKNNIEYNSKILDDAYKNMCMGSFAIDRIITKIKNANFRNLLKKQNEFYLEYTEKINNLAKSLSYKPKDLNFMLKISSCLSINIRTLFNKNTPHIAEMLIKGTTMGITTLIKEVKKNPKADEKIIEISNEIISSQEQFVESLKDFL